MQMLVMHWASATIPVAGRYCSSIPWLVLGQPRIWVQSIIVLQQAAGGPQDGGSAAEQGPGLSWEAMDGLFIVRFKEYKMAAQHKRSLQEGLRGTQQSWQWLDRENKAAQHPTDFGLLRIAGAALQTARVSMHAATRMLQGAPFARMPPPICCMQRAIDCAGRWHNCMHAIVSSVWHALARTCWRGCHL